MAIPLDYASRQRLQRTQVQKQADPVPPPTSATDRFMDAIRKRQAEQPGLSVVAASDALRKTAPELYDAYLAESRYPHRPAQPVTKQTAPAPTPEAVLKAARTRADANATSCRTELFALCKEYEGTAHIGTVAEAWRRYHVSAEAVDDSYAEQLQTPPTKK